MHTLCDHKCGELEKSLHFFYCTTPKARIFIKELMTTIKIVVKVQCTSMPIYTLIVDSLHQLTQQKDAPTKQVIPHIQIRKSLEDMVYRAKKKKDNSKDDSANSGASPNHRYILNAMTLINENIPSAAGAYDLPMISLRDASNAEK